MTGNVLQDKFGFKNNPNDRIDTRSSIINKWIDTKAPGPIYTFDDRLNSYGRYSLKPLGLVYKLTDYEINTEYLHLLWSKFRMRGMFEKNVFPKEDGLSTIMSELPLHYKSILLNLTENAYLYLSKGKTENARNKIAIVESLAPESNYAHHAKGMYYIAVNDLDKALAEFEEAIKSNRDDLLSIAWQGYVLSSKGELNKARECYTKASELAKYDPWFMKKLNRIFSRGREEYLKMKVSEKG